MCADIATIPMSKADIPGIDQGLARIYLLSRLVDVPEFVEVWQLAGSAVGDVIMAVVSRPVEIRTTRRSDGVPPPAARS